MNALKLDEHLGRRLRHRRRILGMTQAALGQAAGTSFQQIHKYEAGAASMSARRLWQIAEVLEVPISYFFEGLRADAPRLVEVCSDPEETAAVTSLFGSMRETQRRRFLDLALALAGTGEHRALRALEASARRLPANG